MLNEKIIVSLYIIEKLLQLKSTDIIQKKKTIEILIFRMNSSVSNFSTYFGSIAEYKADFHRTNVL